MQKTVKAFMSSARAMLKLFRKDQMGNITMMLGLSAVPMLLAAGAGIDMVRINREQAAFNAAVDSATLAIAADDRAAFLGLTDSQKAARITELTAYAKQYLNENYTPQYANDSDISVALTVTGSTIDITASHDFPTTIMKLAGVNDVTLTSTSQVKKAARPIEIALVMDTTGSMASGGKIEGAKAAAKSLLDTIYGGTISAEPQSEFVRVALVPFAAAVRINPNISDFNLGWIDTTGLNPLSKLNFTDTTYNNYMAWGKLKTSSSTYLKWNGCVEARMRGVASSGTDYNDNDVAPTSATPATLFPAYFSPDTPNNSSGSGGSYGYDYISASGTPNETTGLTTAQKNDYTNAGLLLKQKNQAKYVNKVISAESTSTTGPWSGCAASAIVPMTFDRSHVVAGIDAMAANGPTLIAEGLAWGLRVMSPTEPFSKVEGTASIPAATIAPYNDVRWQKTMVLMTDGDNDLSAGSYGYNGTIYSSYGRSGETLATNRFGTTTSSSIMTTLDNELLSVCSKIKAQNIALYVTSFGTGVSATTKARLQSCATKPENYQNNTSSADLQAFFNHIGEEVLNKSIYVSK